ncbi:hypothetical protein K1719_022219 [Acacia pycnantha]|nr:hypothetical protein K1719_022219 [Acacia pycnantha]
MSINAREKIWQKGLRFQGPRRRCEFSVTCNPTDSPCESPIFFPPLGGSSPPSCYDFVACRLQPLFLPTSILHSESIFIVAASPLSCSVVRHCAFKWVYLRSILS